MLYRSLTYKQFYLLFLKVEKKYKNVKFTSEILRKPKPVMNTPEQLNKRRLVSRIEEECLLRGHINTRPLTRLRYNNNALSFSP